MDELAERAKLALLDLTDDVIELIIDKKRKAFAKKQEEIAAVVVPTVDEIPDIEPTYYPPPIVPESITVETPVDIQSHIQEPIVQQEQQAPRRRPLPWQKK